MKRCAAPLPRRGSASPERRGPDGCPPLARAAEKSRNDRRSAALRLSRVGAARSIGPRPVVSERATGGATNMDASVPIGRPRPLPAEAERPIALAAAPRGCGRFSAARIAGGVRRVTERGASRRRRAGPRLWADGRRPAGMIAARTRPGRRPCTRAPSIGCQDLEPSNRRAFAGGDRRGAGLDSPVLAGLDGARSK
jgi:hypothetical protein